MRNETSDSFLEYAWRVAIAASTALAIASCGGAAGGGTSGGGGVQKGNPVVVLSIVDSNGNPITLLGAGNTATAVAVATDSSNAPVTGVIVTFTAANSGGTTLVNFSPLSGSAVTDSTGTAKVTVGASGAGGGAVNLTATVTINGAIVTDSKAFTIGQTSTTGLQISSFVTQAGGANSTINSYGTTAVYATVTTTTGAVPATPVPVNFAISGGACAAGTASITGTSNTSIVGGVATAAATFTDVGCARTAAQTVTISASLASSPPPLPSVNIKINAPTSGSLKFVSSSPSGTAITLKGQGGNGRQTYATLKFELDDVAGNPVGNYPVCLDATTYSGGLTVDGFNNLIPPTGTQLGTAAACGTDNTLFYVKNTDALGSLTVQVNSGTAPTPVRVRARASYPAGTSPLLETLSDLLVISTGLAVDKNMDLSVDVANLEGRDWSGEVATFTVRLADLFGNPVADGTQVNFVTSGGSICTASQGACTTSNGTCTCKLTTGAYRPEDGRVVVMAYAIGLPDYTDVNNNFQFDPGTDYFYPLGDVFIDANKNDAYDTNGVAINGDVDRCFPYVNGNLCAPNLDNMAASTSSDGTGTASAAHPNTAKFGPVYISRSEVVFFSGTSGNLTTVVIPKPPTGPALIGGNSVAVPCSGGAIPMALMDGWGNPMPYSIPLGQGTSLQGSGGTNSNASMALGSSTVGVVGPHPPRTVTDFPNLPKTSITLTPSVDPQLYPTGHTVNVTWSSPSGASCTTGAPGSVQILVKSPHGTAQPACVILEGETNPATGLPFPQGTCPRTSIPITYQ
jgi:hypothetical protein